MPHESSLVVVTGASGFIASHCIAQLLTAGYRVRGTLRTPKRSEEVKKAMLAACTEEGVERLSFVQADLAHDDGWAEAMEGASYVLHVASPLLAHAPKNEDDFIAPAKGGTLRALSAASASGVRRFVMTSSIAAVMCSHKRKGDYVHNERDWSALDAPGIGAYEKSKTIAERAAWDFMESQNTSMEFVAVHPGLVLGPLLLGDYSPSQEVVRKLMAKEVPGCPKVTFACVDVRDVARGHILAMTNTAAANKRYILANPAVPMVEIARILRDQYAGRGFRIPAWELPNVLLRVVALFDANVRLIVPELGKPSNVSSERARTELGWTSRSLREMVLATADSFLHHGIVTAPK